MRRVPGTARPRRSGKTVEPLDLGQVLAPGLVALAVALERRRIGPDLLGHEADQDLGRLFPFPQHAPGKAQVTELEGNAEPVVIAAVAVDDGKVGGFQGIVTNEVGRVGGGRAEAGALAVGQQHGASRQGRNVPVGVKSVWYAAGARHTAGLRPAGPGRFNWDRKSPCTAGSRAPTSRASARNATCSRLPPVPATRWSACSGRRPRVSGSTGLSAGRSWCWPRRGGSTPSWSRS